MNYTQQNIDDIKYIIRRLHENNEENALFLESKFKDEGPNWNVRLQSGAVYNVSFLPVGLDEDNGNSFKSRVERIINLYVNGDYSAIKALINFSPSELDKGELCLFRFCENDEELRIAANICMKKLEGTRFKVEHRNRPSRNPDWPGWAYAKRSRARMLPKRDDQ